eukprot:1025052-Pelagomonas_calceolata.AAC.3
MDMMDRMWSAEGSGRADADDRLPTPPSPMSPAPSTSVAIAMDVASACMECMELAAAAAAAAASAVAWVVRCGEGMLLGGDPRSAHRPAPEAAGKEGRGEV